MAYNVNIHLNKTSVATDRKEGVYLNTFPENLI